MTREKNVVPQDQEAQQEDRRDRFVLRGGDDVADSVPADPEETIDVEQALRRLGDPERRTRIRRHREI